MAKEQWVKDFDARMAAGRKKTAKHFREKRRQKAIRRIRSSWASPYRTSKNIPEHVIRSYM